MEEAAIKLGVSEPGVLIVERDGARVLELKLERGRTVLGAHPTCDVVLPGDDLPPAALVVMDTGDRFHVRRLDPTIALPGAEDDELALAPGEPLQLGPHSIRLERRVARPRVPDRTRVLDGRAPEGADALRARTFIVQVNGVTHRASATRSFAIGSHEDNDLVLDDPFVSGFHCRLLPTERGWTLVDLRSTNGTLLDGLRVREAELPPRAEVTVGQTRLSLSQDDVFATNPMSDHGMLGDSRALQELLENVANLAPSAEPVLVSGESGTGKELVARALHAASARPGPFLAINCGALSEALVESELFGHVKGAFTGAESDRPGAFEATRGGTLFLDEIGELPLSLQPKLLRALETSTVRPVGGTTEIDVDVRIVAATHRNLEQLVAEGRFREDLFHRLFVLALSIPPLRERPEDIVPLARHFLEQQPGRRTLTPAAETRLLEHDWPGNVRELRNAIVRALYAAGSGAIEPEHLQFAQRAFGGDEGTDARRFANSDERAQRARMVEALRRAGGNRSEAARLLGVSKSTFFDRLRRYGIG